MIRLALDLALTCAVILTTLAIAGAEIAIDDLEKAYNLAYHIVAKFGMDKELGYIAFPDPQYTKPYGEKVEATVDR